MKHKQILSNPLLVAAVVLGVAILCYAPTLNYPFLFDDRSLVVENPRLRSLWNIRAIFTTNYWGNAFNQELYRPLTHLSFAMNYAVSGLQAWSYHAGNIVLHALGSLLVWRVALLIHSRQAAAWLAAILFAAHPIHTEAVANVAGRAELLAVVLVLAAWIWHQDYVWREANTGSGFLAALFFAGALFSKENGINLLIVAGLGDVWRLRDRRGPFVWRRLSGMYCAYGAVLLGYLGVRALIFNRAFPVAQDVPFMDNPLVNAATLVRLATAAKVYVLYLLKLVFPVNLSADYSFAQIRLSHMWWEAPALLSVFCLGALGLIALRGWWARSTLGFGLAVALLTLLPTSNVPFPIGTIMAERLVYLPSVGFCVALGALVYSAVSERPAWRSAAIAAGVSIVIALIVLTMNHQRVWMSNMRLWRATFQAAPRNWKAAYNLGLALRGADRTDAGLHAYQHALAIYPDDHNIYANLGIVYFEHGYQDRAIRTYQRGLRLAPDFELLFSNMGRSLHALGRERQARQLYRRAVSRTPSFTVGWYNLANSWLRGKAYDRALLAYLRVLKLDAGNAPAWNNLGAVWRRRGFRDRAMRAYLSAVRSDPRHLSSLLNFGGLLFEEAKYRRAAGVLSRAQQRSPDNATVYRMLREVYRQLNDEPRRRWAERRLQRLQRSGK